VTAATVRSLVDLGCTIVGKVKMTSFGNWEEPVDYIDFEAPWNPRADGHQSSGGSSSGSAAACAAYEWLDIAMGADSKLPHHRVWQHNAACPLGGRIWSSTIIPCSLQCGNGANDRVSRPKSLTPVAQAHLDSTMDTPCFMGRDLTLCKKFATAWYGSSLKRTDVVYTFNLFSSWLC
jgi:hypothetical protein